MFPELQNEKNIIELAMQGKSLPMLLTNLTKTDIKHTRIQNDVYFLNK